VAGRAVAGRAMADLAVGGSGAGAGLGCAEARGGAGGRAENGETALDIAGGVYKLLDNDVI
jgi:hypothetical protein